MVSKLSVYATPTHGDGWLRYVTGLKPYDTLILGPDIQEVSDAFVGNPEGEVSIRFWEWDDGRGYDGNPHGIYRLLEENPEECADLFIDRYRTLFDDWDYEAKERNLPWPDRSKLLAHLINEPDTNYLSDQINRFTVRATRGLWRFGIRTEGLNFSTGHPAILVDGKPWWEPFLPSLRALAECHGYAVEHEYFNSLGIQDPSTNPWHVGRMKKWAPRIPGLRWKIGEFGLEELVNNVLPHHHGYIGRIPNEQMVWSTKYYLEQLLHPDCVSVRIFMTDFEDRTWSTFDTHPIHNELIAVGHMFLYSPSSNPPAPSGMVVIAPLGVNVRSGPGTEYERIHGLPQDETVTPIAIDPSASWVEIDWPVEGWVNLQWLQWEGESRPLPVKDAPPKLPAPPSPPTKPSRILDPVESLAFMLVEGAGQAFVNGRLQIRFEVHRFEHHLKNDELFNKYFKFTPGNYSEQYYRATETGEWVNVHRDIETRHRALGFARSLDNRAALLSTGMGVAQIMGENYARIGYSSPEQMFRAFSNPKFGDEAQVFGFLAYVMSDPDLFDAMKRRDWYEVITRYNGEGQQALYERLLKSQIATIRQEIGD